MRRIHLLRVAAAPEVFGPLFAAAAAGEVSIGWLDLGDPAPAEGLPANLRGVLDAGSRRAVVVGEGWTLSARRRPGPPRLRDLLRQQFLGCAVVLVRGELDAPRLAPLGDGRWSVLGGDGRERRLDTGELLAALRGAHPFRSAGEPDADGGGEGGEPGGDR